MSWNAKLHQTTKIIFYLRAGIEESTKSQNKSSFSTAATAITDGGLKLRQVDVLGVQEGMLQDLAVGIDRLYKKVRDRQTDRQTLRFPGKLIDRIDLN